MARRHYLTASRLWQLQTSSSSTRETLCASARDAVSLQLAHLSGAGGGGGSTLDPTVALVTAGDWAAAKDTLSDLTQQVLTGNHDTLHFHESVDRNRFLSGLFYTSASIDCTIASLGDPEESVALVAPVVAQNSVGDLTTLMGYVCEDIAAFSREKYGVCPEMEITAEGEEEKDEAETEGEETEGEADEAVDGSGDEGISAATSPSRAPATCRVVEGHVHFIACELLKNAVVSMMKRHGILEVREKRWHVPGVVLSAVY
jgi:hypothetical protein